MTDEIAELRRKIADYKDLARQTTDAQAREAIQSLISEYSRAIDLLEKTQQPADEELNPPKA